MFQFPSFPSLDYGFIKWSLILHQRGFPIRKSADRSLFAAPRSLSQLVTSFVGSWCQGIHLVLFIAWTSLSLLSFAWVSQIICLQWKSFFLSRCNREYFVFACEMRFSESQEIFWRGANRISDSHSLMHRVVLFCFLVRLFFRTCGQIVVFHDFQKDLQNYFANL